MTTKDDIRGWLDSAPKDATYMVVVCDTFDYEDYPVYVTKGQKCADVVAEHSKNMQKVMEVYDLSTDLEKQLDAPRARAVPFEEKEESILEIVLDEYRKWIKKWLT